MKKFYLVLVLFLISFSCPSFADISTQITLKDVLEAENKEMILCKIRVYLEELILTQSGIFICLDEKFLPVESVASDSSGLYCILDNSYDCGDALWECSYRHTLNPMKNSKCRNCGTWR